MTDLLAQKQQLPPRFPNPSNSHPNISHRLRPLTHAVGVIDKTLRLPGHHPSEPKALRQALVTADVRAWDTAYHAEIAHHAVDLRTWYLDDELSSDKPLPYVMTYRAKTNMHGVLERHKVRCAIRGVARRTQVSCGTRGATRRLETSGWHKVLVEPSMFWISTAMGTARMEVGSDQFLVTAPDDVIFEVLSRPSVDAWIIVIKKLTPETPLESTIDAAPKAPQIPKYDSGDPMDTQVFSKTDTVHVDTATAPRPGGDNADTASEENKKASKVGPSHQRRPPISLDNRIPKHVVLQHVGPKITKSEDGSNKISNAKIIHRLWRPTDSRTATRRRYSTKSAPI